MKPTRVLHIPAASFATPVVCLGSQVATILASIDKVVPHLSWYAADVECTGGRFGRRTQTAVRVGGADALMDEVLRVHQFMSGVFVGVPPELAEPRFREGGLWTDDDEGADLGDAVVEVRAFDTTYISVASTNEALLRSLESAFGTD